MKDFRTLLVWQKAHQLVLMIYRATAGFPPEERFGLTSQLRRTAVSVPANIAEGCGRQGDAEFARFLGYSAGSASEVEYHLLLSRDLGLLHQETHRELEDQTTEVKRMLAALIAKIRADR